MNKATVTDIGVDSTGKDQRFQVTVIRHPGFIAAFEAPVTDLPQDIRDALLQWLGGQS